MSFRKWPSDGADPFTGGGTIDLRIKDFGESVEVAAFVCFDTIVRRDMLP
jgi:hypothetical protein